jgi:hypothetical protein
MQYTAMPPMAFESTIPVFEAVKSLRAFDSGVNSIGRRKAFAINAFVRIGHILQTERYVI